MKTVLVTGASSGIGRATALEFARAGYRVFATVRRQEDAERLRRDALGLAVDVLFCDVRDLESVRATLAEVRRATEWLDVLVNNAGYAAWVSVEDMAIEDFWAMFEVNVRGLVAVTKASLPLLRAGSTIVNVSSLAGRVAVPLMAAYNGTKFAVEGISDSLRMELHPFGIRVVVIEPGPVADTRFSTHGHAVSVPYWGRPSRYETAYDAMRAEVGTSESGAVPASKVAATVRRAAEARRPRDRYVTQHGLSILIRLSKALPRRWVDRGIAKHAGFAPTRGKT